MHAFRTASLVALSIALSPRAAEAQPETLTVLTEQSFTIVDVHKSGVLSPALHDHHFLGDRWAGSVVFDAEHPETVRGSIVIDTASLRDQQPELSPEDEQKVNTEMRGPDVLDAARYPTVTLSFDRMEVLQRGEGTVRGHLLGSLTLHGQTHPIRVPIAASFRAHRLHAIGSTAFNLSEFGIKRPSKALGAIGVADHVEVRFDLSAAVKPPVSP